jgi:CMP-N,N'-diacetyllegionaminic acid synthase
MRTWAVIPARSGSKRVPGKNLRYVGGRPLVEWTLDAALTCRSFDKVLVSSDSEEVRELALSAGADAMVPRPEEISSDTATSHDVAIHALQYGLGHGSASPDAICLLQPTAPLRTAAHVESALSLFRDFPAADCLVSCTTVPNLSLPLYQCLISAYGFLTNLEGGDVMYPSQPGGQDHLARNGAIYITRVPQINEYLVGGRVLPFVMDATSSLDINHEPDLELADAVLTLRYAKS